MESIDGMAEDRDPKNAMNVDRLIASMLDSEHIDQEALTWLEQKLREDDSALHQYLSLVDLDARLHWACRGGQASLSGNEQAVRNSRAEAEIVSQQGSLHTTEVTLSQESIDPRGQAASSRLKGLWQVLGSKRNRTQAIGIAASLAALLLVGVFVQRHSGTASLGNITRSFAAEWNYSGVSLLADSTIKKGKLNLSSGLVEISLNDGTRLIVEGPATFEIVSTGEVYVADGTLSVFVGEGVTGFAVSTPDAHIVDLSTAFQVNVVARGTEVHVLDGEVIAEGSDPQESTKSFEELHLTSRDAVLFRRDDKSPLAIDYTGDRHYLLGSFDLSALPELVAGEIRCLRDAPESVIVGEFEHDEIVMFIERSNTILPKTLYADLNAKGEEARSKGNVRMKMPAGARVNSYLLHFDPKSKNDEDPRHRVSGTVRFRSPILGVFTSHRGLYTSDEYLKHPNTQYSTSAQIGPRGSEDEVISFSPDRKAITVEFDAHKYVDQIRIVTMEEPAPLKQD